MNMTVGDLQAQVAKLDTKADVRTAVNGSFVPVVDVASASGTPFVVIRGQGKHPVSPRFSIGEEGVIGHLARPGVSDDEIGEVLGRPADRVERKRKALGFGGSGTVWRYRPCNSGEKTSNCTTTGRLSSVGTMKAKPTVIPHGLRGWRSN